VRTQVWPHLCEAAGSITVLCSGRKGSCCWDRSCVRLAVLLGVSSAAAALAEGQLAPLGAALPPSHAAESSRPLGEVAVTAQAPR